MDNFFSFRHRWHSLARRTVLDEFWRVRQRIPRAIFRDIFRGQRCACGRARCGGKLDLFHDFPRCTCASASGRATAAPGCGRPRRMVRRPLSSDVRPRRTLRRADGPDAVDVERASARAEGRLEVPRGGARPVRRTGATRRGRGGSLPGVWSDGAQATVAFHGEKSTALLRAADVARAASGARARCGPAARASV